MVEGGAGILNAISIDVEEWYQTVLFRGANENVITDLPDNVFEILSLLEKYDTRATFFVVASLADKYPGIIPAITEKGHEIASHGYSHRLVYRLSRNEFYNDVKLSLDILGKYSGSDILGYRAPTWSITKKDKWALEVLNSLGLKYDSSIYPINANLFGHGGLERFPHMASNGLLEFPPSTFQFLRYNFPFAGGTFLRFFHHSFIEKRIKCINKSGYPAMVYFHTWEFNETLPSQIRFKIKRTIQCGNLHSIKYKMQMLLQSFKFCPIKDILSLGNWPLA